MSKKKYVDEFYLTNIKKHHQLEGKVKGRHFAVTGPNGIGKTTVFQAIRRMLASLPDADKPDQWVTQGEEDGEIRVKLAYDGEVYMSQERISSNPRTRSRVKAWKIAEGNKDELSSPQKRLKELFGNVEDTTPLMDMSGKDQMEFFEKKLGLDVAGYNTKRKALSKVRSDMKTKKKVLEQIMDKTVTDEDAKTYKEPKDVEQVLAKKISVQPLVNEREMLERKMRNISEAQLRINAIDEQIKKLQEEKESLNVEIRNKPKITAAIKKVNDAYDEAIGNNQKVEEELKTVSEHNTMHHKVKEYLKRKGEITMLNAGVKDYDAKVQAVDDEFYKQLAAQELHKAYPGLELVYKPKDEDNEEERIGLYLDGLRFHTSQLSYGLMIKVLIKLSVYLNPDGLNFIYISSWDLLDTKSKQELLDFADAEENVQLGIEKVDDRAEIAIEFIELK